MQLQYGAMQLTTFAISGWHTYHSEPEAPHIGAGVVFDSFPWNGVNALGLQAEYHT